MSADSGSSKSKKSKHHLDKTQLSADQRVAEYLQSARDSWDEAWQFLHSSEWKKEAGVDLEAGIVYAQHVKKYGKIFMLQGYVNANLEFVFNNTVLTVVESPKWNPATPEIKILQNIDKHTDITYTLTADAAGGLIASRDYVDVRHWQVRDGITLSAGCAVVHPDKPPNKKSVRGENKPGGWIFKPDTNNPDRCIFGWIVNTDIKGWIPQYVVDQTISGFLLDFIRNLRAHIEDVKSATK